VTTTAAPHGRAIDRRNAEPLTWVPDSTSRFVRLLPGSSNDAALERKTQPYSRRSSLAPRRRAAPTSTGVRKATDVSRFRTTVTPATRPMATR
jgi:hypothetical protein